MLKKLIYVLAATWLVKKVLPRLGRDAGET